MAKGYDQHQQRTRSLSAFGKDLARRAHSRCELCESGGVSLVTYELAPVPNDPDFARCLMLCETCSNELNEAKFENAARWRCLNNTIWSDTPAVQAAGVIILRRLSEAEPWARELLDQVFLSDGTKQLLDEPIEDEEEQ